MALLGTDQYATYDITDGTQILDISSILLKALKLDEGTLNIIPVGDTTSDVETTWHELALNDYQVQTDNNTYTSAETSITLASNHGARVRVGTILADLASGSVERMQVTALSTDTITVVRGYGGSTKASLVATQSLNIVGNPLPEGSDEQIDVTLAETTGTNVCQIFERTVKITRNQQARAMHSIPDALVSSLDHRAIEVKRELNLAVINGLKAASTSTGSDSVYRSMDGILAFIDTGSSNTRVTTTENLTPKVFSQLIKNIVDTGHDGDNLVALAPFIQRQKISAFDASIRRREESSVKAGQYIDHVLTDLGIEIPVYTDNYIDNDKLIIIDKSRISLRPFVNAAWFIMAAPSLTDGVKRRIIGEYTLELRNADDAHALHNNLSTT